MNYDLLEELNYTGLLGDEGLYELLKKTQDESGLSILKGVRPSVGLSTQKTRAKILEKLVKKTVVDITSAGRKGRLYIDPQQKSLNFKFNDLETKYFIRSRTTEICVNGEDGYYIMICDPDTKMLFYYDNKAMKHYRNKTRNKFPSSEDLKKVGILADRKGSYYYDGKTSYLSISLFCDSLQKVSARTMDYIKHEIEYYEAIKRGDFGFNRNRGWGR